MSASSVVLLPHEPASVSAARWRLAADLSGAGVHSPAISDAALVVSELLSNSIRHATPLPGLTLQVAWTLGNGWLEIAVSDGGAPTIPRPIHQPVSSLSGRGLAIVEQLCVRWGFRTSDWGTTVWAVLAAPGTGQPGGVPAGGHPHRWCAGDLPGGQGVNRGLEAVILPRTGLRSGRPERGE